MRILIFTASDSSMSSIRPEAEMFIGFSRRGHKVTIVTDANSELADIYRNEGIKVVDCQPKKKISLSAIRIVKDELKNHHYDILLAMNSKSIPNGAFAAIGTDVKLVTYRGTTGGLYRHDPSAYLTHLHPRVDGVVCVSDAVREDVQSKVWSRNVKVVTIYKGHNLNWYNKSPADLSEFGISKDDFTLICAVNVRPSKGIPVMIDAADQLADIKNLHLLLVGRNMDVYSEMISKNRMKDRIHITGYRHDVPELIAASDVLVQPSISGEGLPRAVMEAMAYGTATILTTTGGGKEVAQDGVTGFVVPTNNSGAIAEKVRLLYDDPELLSSMGEKSRKRIENDFNNERTIDAYLEYFDSLIKR
ncbi:MAG: glycosyltransferase family 4 protein [Gammaproteobacteria bacterium]|nr:glycosyltransferase family 4 protein [Gammaproteobacteria bacterium]